MGGTHENLKGQAGREETLLHPQGLRRQNKQSWRQRIDQWFPVVGEDRWGIREEWLTDAGFVFEAMIFFLKLRSSFLF